MLNRATNFRAIGILPSANELSLSDKGLAQIDCLTLASWKLWLDYTIRRLVLHQIVFVLVMNLPMHLLERRYRLLNRALAIASLHDIHTTLV